MSINIKGMKMPESCEECEFCDIYDHGEGDEFTCELTWAYTFDYFDYKSGRLPNCPLVELPPHGRLIDADELMLIIQDYIEEYDGVDGNGYHDLKWCAMKEAEMAINDAPAIIEAEGEKE